MLQVRRNSRAGQVIARVGALRIVTFLVLVTFAVALGVVIVRIDPAIYDDAARLQPAVAFPNDANTGVPPGTSLEPYEGPCRITESSVHIDSAIVNCDRLVVASQDVKITKSQLPPVDVDGEGWSVVIEDSTILGGEYSGPAVGYRNLTIRRSEIRGAQHSVLCGSSCLIEDSWLHDQALPMNEEWHNNAYLSNGGSGVTLRGNTFECSPPDNAVGGGCSGDVSLFGDFAEIDQVKIERNLFKTTPGSFCLRLGFDPDKAYGSGTSRVEMSRNVFESGTSGTCGSVGPVTSVAPGTVMDGNQWTDGSPVLDR